MLVKILLRLTWKIEALAPAAKAVFLLFEGERGGIMHRHLLGLNKLRVVSSGDRPQKSLQIQKLIAWNRL